MIWSALIRTIVSPEQSARRCPLVSPPGLAAWARRRPWAGQIKIRVVAAGILLAVVAGEVLRAEWGTGIVPRPPY